jgi:hypothetical protein
VEGIGLQYGFCEFFEKQWHAICLLHEVIQHLCGQHRATRDTPDQRCGLRG